MKEFLLFGKGFKKVDQWQDGCWVNICSPTQDDINYMEGLGVPDSFISDIRDPNERPRVERDGDARVFLCEVLEFVIDLHRHQAPVDCGFCFDSGAAMTFSGVTVAAAPSMRPTPVNCASAQRSR